MLLPGSALGILVIVLKALHPNLMNQIALVFLLCARCSRSEIPFLHSFYGIAGAGKAAITLLILETEGK